MGEVTTAYHEAGHVIMANVINWQYKDVTVVPGESYLGKIALESPPPDILEALACSSFLPWQRKWLAQKILLCVAGMVAERIAGLINEDDYWNVETGFAVDLAVEGGLWIEHEASGDSLFKADVPAERLLRRHWPEVGNSAPRCTISRQAPAVVSPLSDMMKQGQGPTTRQGPYPTNRHSPERNGHNFERANG